LEIEEDPISAFSKNGFENGAGSVANTSEIQEDSSCHFHPDAESRASNALFLERDAEHDVERDVWTDQPTSTLEDTLNFFLQSTRFSSAQQEVPEGITELGPEELNAGHEVPDPSNIDRKEPTQVKREELLYSNISTTGNENTATVDNEDIQRALNLAEIFSFLKDDEETGSTAADSDDDDASNTTMQDRKNEMETEEAALGGDSDLFDSNSFPVYEFETPFQTGKRKGACLSFGRGEPSPTHTNSWKKNKAYFHLGRFPFKNTKQDWSGEERLDDVGETQLPTGSRPASPSQSFASWTTTPQSLSCCNQCAATQSTKGTRNSKSKLPVPYIQRVIYAN